MPVFVGQRRQRGHGLGQTISGLFKRYVVPFVAPRAKEFGKKILGNVARTGMEMLGDVVSGKNVKQTLKERGLEGIKRTFHDVIGHSPSVRDRVDVTPASKRGKQSTVTKKKKTAQKKKKKKVTASTPSVKTKDIFD